MKELLKRKRLRLQDYDYSTPGAYFITVSTHQKQKTLSRIVGAIHESPETELTEYGKIVQYYIEQLSTRFSLSVDGYVIMPNHIHIILILSETGDARAIRESPLREQTRSKISKAIGYVKMNASKQIRQKFGVAHVWHRGYHDHIIRNASDYESIAKYVAENPLRWELDCFYSPEE